MNFLDVINEAKEQECSDVHITVGTPIAYRRFGRLKMKEPAPTPQESVDLILQALDPTLIEKVLAGQDIDCAMLLPDGTRLRANVYHQRNNLAASYRILKQNIPTFDELDIPHSVRKLVNEPRGLVLVTGPTGSGKSTTLASMIDYINKRMEKHIITIEDPIEYVYPYSRCMIHQREIGADVEDFATALRSSLREDPDIILVGEMRDYETIKAAIAAAETGHLVFSTLHTSSAAQTIERIVDSFPPHGQDQARTQLATVLKGICSQVLIPKADGSGMSIATEVLINTDGIANQIRENKSHLIQSSIQSGNTLGMHTLASDIDRLVKAKIVKEEVAKKFL